MEHESSCPKCTECGTPLVEGIPSGLCLRCLLALGLREGEDAPGVPEPPPAADADSFDRYRVIEKLGEGGCGVVYRAEQLEPVRREVALKVIKLGMDTQAVLSRFQAERQALALMAHPNIARVYDAGASRSGRPFFAMELVAGEPITTYCDRRNFTLRRRLELFIQVCRALEHAHQKGIVHRDIKPSNILVAEQDGLPTPKVIDFGVAKATSAQRLADQTEYTAFEQFIGTPAYMSPEQATLVGDDIDRRSDLYSLGVLLYELLTGRPPFEAERLRQAAIDEVCRIIRQEEPARPSARVSTLSPEQRAAIARCRMVPDARLAGHLRGDLDWMVMKALEKERHRRYASAAELAADIGCFLSDQPVSATPPGLPYLLRKFIRRNRTLAIAIAAVTLALLTGLVVSNAMFFREKKARRWAEARAYTSDMGLAAHAATQPFGLGNAGRLLDFWQDCKPDRRGWEWFFLYGLCHEERAVVSTGDGALSCVAWSPDGTRFACGGTEGRVAVYDVQDRDSGILLDGFVGMINSITWHPSGRRLAACGEDGTIRILDMVTGERENLPTGTVKPLLALAWSPDGHWLAMGCSDKTVRLWDVENGTWSHTWICRRVPRSLAWSRDGSRLAAVGDEEFLMEWDVSSGKRVLDFDPESGHGAFRAIGWSPDDRVLAIGGDNFAIKFFDAATGTNTATVWGHPSGIAAVAWNPDGTRLASADKGNGNIYVCDTTDRRMVRVFRGHQGPAKAVAWQPNGSLIASAGSDGTLRLWDASRENRSVRRIRHADQVLSISWHPDGRRLAVGGRHDSAAIWDADRLAKPVDLHSPVNWVWRVAWNPAGTLLASVGDDSTIRLWQPDGREAGRLRVPAGGIRALAWSPDGTSVAYSGKSCGLNLWNPSETNSTLLSDLGHSDSLAVAWSPDGTRLAAGAGPRIRVFDAHSGKQQHALAGHSDAVRALAWSPDSKRLASASDDSLAKIWDAETGRETAALIGHSAPVYAVAWSPEGTRLATGSWDHLVKIWDPATGIELCSLAEHPAAVADVAFSPDGNRLASSDLDGIIVVRDAAPGREAEERGRGLKGSSPASPPGDPAQPAAWRRDILERRAEGGDLDSMCALAWLLATSPYGELRDGPRAVEVGKKAAETTHWNNCYVLTLLAAAYAETGDFTNAVAVQKKAIALTNNRAAIKEYTAHLRLYESGTPCRDYDF